MAPLDIGEAVIGGAETAVKGAKGVVETATSGARGAAKTAAAGVSTATNAVNGAKGQFDDAKGMLGMFTKIQGYITKIQEAWDKYRYLIIFIVCLIIFIYISLTIYCCYHFVHDFFRCACCCVRCTYKCERYLWKHRGPMTDCLCKPCRSCTKASSSQKDPKREKEAYHKCSGMCLKAVPRSTRMELEKQHGDLRKGWFDSTYFARSCGRFELPEDEEERMKWHWYGHEDQRIHKLIKKCTPKPSEADIERKENIAKARRKQREKYWNNLVKGIDKLGENANDLYKRIPRRLAEQDQYGQEKV